MNAASIIAIARNSSPRSLYDQNRALRELHDTIRPTTEHALIQRRVAGRPDDEQFDMELGCELDDVPDPSRCRRGDSHIQSGADDACAAPPGRRTSSPASNLGASVLSNTALFNRHITNSRSLLWRQESSASSAVLGDPIPFCAARFQSGIKWQLRGFQPPWRAQSARTVDMAAWAST